MGKASSPYAYRDETAFRKAAARSPTDPYGVATGLKDGRPPT